MDLRCCGRHEVPVGYGMASDGVHTHLTHVLVSHLRARPLPLPPWAAVWCTVSVL